MEEKLLLDKETWEVFKAWQNIVAILITHYNKDNAQLNQMLSKDIRIIEEYFQHTIEECITEYYEDEEEADKQGQ